MTRLNYIGLAIEGIFGGASFLLLMISFIKASWKWGLLTFLSVIIFFIGALIAID